MSAVTDRERALALALDLWGQGQDWEQAAAGLPPEEAAELRRAMALAPLLRDGLPPASPAAEARSRAAWLAAAELAAAEANAGAASDARPPAARRAAGTRRSEPGAWTRLFRAPRRLAWLAAGLAAWLVLGGGVVWAAERSLPGDGLYPIKTWRYDVQVAMARDAEGRLRALQAQEDSYRRDCEEVLALGREVAVEFFGRVEQVEGGTWRIGGLPVDVSGADLSAILTSARPFEGRRVLVEGRTEGGRLVALHLYPADLPDTPGDTGASVAPTVDLGRPTPEPASPTAPLPSDGSAVEGAPGRSDDLTPNQAPPLSSVAAPLAPSSDPVAAPAGSAGGDDKGGDDEGGDDEGGDDKGGDDKGGDDKGGGRVRGGEERP